MMTKLCHSLWDYIVQRVELQWYAAVAVAICLCRLCSFPGNILSVITIAQLFRADKANRETINSANESFETVAGKQNSEGEGDAVNTHHHNTAVVFQQFN